MAPAAHVPLVAVRALACTGVPWLRLFFRSAMVGLLKTSPTPPTPERRLSKPLFPLAAAILAGARASISGCVNKVEAAGWAPKMAAALPEAGR